MFWVSRVIGQIFRIAHVLARGIRSACKASQNETLNSVSGHMSILQNKRAHLPRTTRQVESVRQAALLNLIIAEVSCGQCARDSEKI